MTSRGELHTGPNIGDVGGQVFFDQNGMPFPTGFGVINSPEAVRYDIPTSAGKRRIIRAENTSVQGFDSDIFSVKMGGSVVTLLASSVGGQTIPCEASATTLCVQGDRFKVTVDWDDGLDSGVGSTFDPGYEGGFFSFFGAGDTEVLVRILDGCAGPTGSYWVFAAGNTDIGYNLTVTDTATGNTTEYQNPLGSMAPAILDTAAFTTCP